MEAESPETPTATATTTTPQPEEAKESAPQAPTEAAPKTDTPAGPAAESAADGKTEAEAGPGTTTVNDMKDWPTLLHTIVVRDAKAALKWYCEALGGRVTFRYEDDTTGLVRHAVVSTDYGVRIAVEDYYPEMHMVKPAEIGASVSGCSYVYVTLPKGMGSADQAVERMREAGATVIQECTDMFYGHRLGKVVDKWGHAWVFSHEIEGGNGKK